MAGAALWLPDADLWQAQHFVPTQGHVQISWQAQHFRKVKCRLRGRRSIFASSGVRLTDR